MNRGGATFDHAAADLRIELLGRWPVLDDPWHPEFAAQYADNRDAIARAMRDGATAQRYARLRGEHHGRGLAYDAAKVAAARARVLARAWDTVARAAQLRRQGGEPWQRYRALVRCERGTLQR